MKTKPFTLVELLVVMAVIGLLISILLPSLRRAKGKAQQAVCLSNNRQIFVAMMEYTKNNKSKFPVAAAQNDRPVGYSRRALTWDDMLSDYDGRRLSEAEKKLNGGLPAGSASLYKCPASPYKRDDNIALRSYGINKGHIAGGGFTGISHYDQSRYVAEVEDSNTFLLVESILINMRNILGRGGNSMTAGSTYGMGRKDIYIHSPTRLTSLSVDGSVRATSILTEGLSPQNFWTYYHD